MFIFTDLHGNVYKYATKKQGMEELKNTGKSYAITNTNAKRAANPRITETLGMFGKVFYEFHYLPEDVNYLRTHGDFSKEVKEASRKCYLLNHPI